MVRTAGLLTALVCAVACGGSETSGPDAGVDAAVDAGVEAAVDAGSDAGFFPPCDAGPPIDRGDAAVVYTETRTPCADRDPLRHVYFGDLHVHTSTSFDSWAVGNRTTPADAYRFARGEAVQVYGGPMGATRTVQLTRPLDFAAVTDHSEFLGEVNICLDSSAPGYMSSTCATYRGGGTVGFAILAAPLLSSAPTRNRTICGAGNADCITHATQVWQEEQAAAEAAYDRTSACRFTSLIAYEWSSTPNGDNLHRNVIFRNTHVPDAPVSIFEAPTPPELWQRLGAVCNACNGCEDLIIPHNSNLSGGNMFSLDYLAGLDATARHDALATRAANERLVEVSQHKGTSECLPTIGLGPTDEDCDFELETTSLLGGATGTLTPLPLCNGDGTGASTNCISRDSYVRNALAEGLAEEARSGVNPFPLGFIGSTDTHNGTPGNVDEATFQGHLASQDFGPLMLTPNAPGGIAAVWSVENSRDAIFEALARRETYATSGPRIVLRVFGGFGWDNSLCSDAMLVSRGFAEGVPMGGTLDASAAAGRAPTFVIEAMQDQAPLAAAQMIKAWADAAGVPHTQVYPVEAPVVGTLDTATCVAGGGTGSLCKVWQDPDFDPHVHAAYYVRVLEVPTCRWTQFQCNAMAAGSRPAACTDGSIALTLEERAWSSPIWMTAAP